MLSTSDRQSLQTIVCVTGDTCKHNRRAKSKNRDLLKEVKGTEKPQMRFACNIVATILHGDITRAI